MNLTSAKRHITKTEMIEEAGYTLKSLSPSVLKPKIKENIKLLKKEKLKGSLSYEEVAEEFGIYPRSLREYVSGKRKPGLGQPATRYGFLLEKYYLNKELNRWFVLDDYK